MKNLLLSLSFAIICSFSYSQTVYTVDYESQADLKVYAVDYESQCDLKVYKVDYDCLLYTSDAADE